MFEREGREKNMKNLQIDNKTRQVRVSKELHQALKISASEEGKSMKALLEEALKSFGISEE